MGIFGRHRERSASIGERLLSELIEMRGELSRVGETTDRVEVQTTKTNGRVAALEEWRDTHDHRMDIEDTMVTTRRTVRAEDRQRIASLWSVLSDDFIRLLPWVAIAGGYIAERRGLFG